MWWYRYIGLPYEKGGRGTDGVDCWGLVLASYRDNHPTIVLPEYGAVTVDEIKEVAAAIRHERKTGTWIQIEPGDEREFDIAVMPSIALGRSDDFHVGIISRPGHVMHSEEDTGVTEGRFRDDGPYRADFHMRFRRVSLYRHKDLAGGISIQVTNKTDAPISVTSTQNESGGTDVNLSAEKQII